jgi:hypothetical protein
MKNTANRLLALILGTALALVAGCGDGGSSCQPGNEKCSCLVNGTCNAGLTCASGVCVGLGGQTGQGGQGGPSGPCGAIDPQCSSIATDASGTCIAECCCPQFVACANNSSCRTILSCGDNCTGTACVDSCLSANPAGATAATSALSCVQTHCL